MLLPPGTPISTGYSINANLSPLHFLSMLVMSISNAHAFPGAVALINASELSIAGTALSFALGVTTGNRNASDTPYRL